MQVNTHSFNNFCNNILTHYVWIHKHTGAASGWIPNATEEDIKRHLAAISITGAERVLSILSNGPGTLLTSSHSNADSNNADSNISDGYIYMYEY
jgi:hypothetical protein